MSKTAIKLKWDDVRKIRNEPKYEATVDGVRWIITGKRDPGDRRMYYSVYRSYDGYCDTLAGGWNLMACRTLAEAKALVSAEAEKWRQAVAA